MKNVWKQFAAGLVLGVAAQVAQAGVVWSVNGHEYALVNDEGVTWTNADAAALALPGDWYLATITSEAENNFVIDSLLQVEAISDSRAHYWIGATDANGTGSFAWTTGEAFDYTNWWGNEPNNLGSERFVAYDFRQADSVRMSWGWNNAPDDLDASFPGWANGYLIEREARASVPVPGALSLLGLGLGLLAASTRRRVRA
jgi:hypothetical protein